MRMSVDLPAPFGPSRPNMPARNRQRDVVERAAAAAVRLGQPLDPKFHCRDSCEEIAYQTHFERDEGERGVPYGLMFGKFCRTRFNMSLVALPSIR